MKNGCANPGGEALENLRQALAETIAENEAMLSREYDLDMDAYMRGRVDALKGVLLYMIPIAQMKAWEKR